MSKLLIAGVRGQDGYFLASLLIQAGNEVVGLTRDITQESMTVESGINIRLVYTDYSVMSLLSLLKEHRPSCIVNLAGQSSVGRSWEVCDETIISQGVYVGNFLQAILKHGEDILMINASSSEIFATTRLPITEQSSLSATNPYGCAQSLGHQLINAYRKNFGLRCCNMILFPHESIRRSPYFVFRKVIRTSILIAKGEIDYLRIGNLDVKRDWGHAAEYMQAVLRVIQNNCCTDICLCTGTTFSVREVIMRSFSNVGLDWSLYTGVDKSLERHEEPPVIYGSNVKAITRLGWKPTLYQDSLVDYIQSQEASLLR